MKTETALVAFTHELMKLAAEPEKMLMDILTDLQEQIQAKADGEPVKFNYYSIMLDASVGSPGE